jgi:hypothetical protein
MDTVKDL